MKKIHVVLHILGDNENVSFIFSALITAFEKSKKKYQSKMKKMECQLQAMAERYEAQVSAGELCYANRPLMS